jgi:hypothetical protein
MKPTRTFLGTKQAFVHLWNGLAFIVSKVPFGKLFT